MYGVFRQAATAVLWLIFIFPFAAHAVPSTYDLTFKTTGQSIWDHGSSVTLDQTTFLGAAWQDKSAGINLIAGDEDTNVINIFREAYDVAFAACNLAFSASSCINGQAARAPVPALGSRPSVRSCGKFNFICQTAVSRSDRTRRL